MHNVEILRYLMQYDDISIGNDILFPSTEIVNAVNLLCCCLLIHIEMNWLTALCCDVL